MVKISKTKLKKYGNAKVIVIPASLYSDSTFPFKLEEKLEIGIVDGRLEIIGDENETRTKIE